MLYIALLDVTRVEFKVQIYAIISILTSLLIRFNL